MAKQNNNRSSTETLWTIAGVLAVFFILGTLYESHMETAPYKDEASENIVSTTPPLHVYDTSTEKVVVKSIYSKKDSLRVASIRSTNDSIRRADEKAEIANLIGQCDFDNFSNIEDLNDLGKKRRSLVNLRDLVDVYRSDSKTLANKFDHLQLRLFPYFRKRMAALYNEAVWIEDGVVKARGRNNEILRLIAADFAANRNIKEVHDAILNNLKTFRFKRVEFLWYEHDDEYTYYKIDSPKDSDPL